MTGLGASRLAKDLGYRRMEIAAYLNKEPAAAAKYGRKEEGIQEAKDAVFRKLKEIS